nr:MAG TPA: Spt4/RpoE2 zinc finger [Caudoviricetes sp.]
MYPLSVQFVFPFCIAVSRACLNCGFIIARLIVIVNIKSL